MDEFLKWALVQFGLPTALACFLLWAFTNVHRKQADRLAAKDEKQADRLAALEEFQTETLVRLVNDTAAVLAGAVEVIKETKEAYHEVVRAIEKLDQRRE